MGEWERHTWERHSVFTHLTGVLLALELLQRQRLSGRQRRVVEHALRSARELRRALVGWIAAPRRHAVAMRAAPPPGGPWPIPGQARHPGRWAER